MSGNCANVSQNDPLGYSTRDALERLHEDIGAVVKEHELKFLRKCFFEKIRNPFYKQFGNPLACFPVLFTCFVICGLCIIQHYFAAFLIFTILITTIALVVYENNLRCTEVHRKIRTVLDDIQLAKNLCSKWAKDNYPNLCSPISPCVTLQWTYRDGVLINLPWALLVKGDFIVMRPGQLSPGHCIEVNGKHEFNSGETYGQPQPADPPLRPTARAPLSDLVCIMQETPYLDNLRTSLGKFLNRPPTIYDQQRDLLITKYIQQWAFLFAIFICLLFGILRHLGILLKDGQWTELFIELPICSVIPILPLVFPIMWISINLWGIARLETLLSMTQTVSKTEQTKSFQEDLDTPTFEWEKTRLPTVQVVANWVNLWRGNSNLLGRSANVVQVLGSITALCCIDKKGILSWPNPTAEKVFFLRDASDRMSKLSKSSLDSEESHTEKPGTSTAEVLDLTHDQHSPFKLEFDDHEWKNHVNSLKPLGLAILVNTCCPHTQEHYARFCGHVTAVAMLDKDLIPVTNRYAIVESRLNSFMHGRCLCELAKQIGFTSQAREIFHLEGQISSYMHLQPEVLKRDIRFARQLQLTSKVKVPFPHCLSVVMREIHSGSLQLLTQGTADIVLDCCDDYWDGKDLRPLGPQERKRAQDFYQRSALTAYCTAFAYRPLRHGITGALAGENNNTAYLELPPESKYRMSHIDNTKCVYSGHGNLHHSISSDSLLFSENKEEDITDVDGCFEMQCHQVFIGMVTMQYQAQTDIVQLVEQLDRACVRFVHFSKENELRSRVFSEKMGLESGWNCHISLLSESDSTLPSPKSGRSHEKTSTMTPITVVNNENEIPGDSELNRLLPPTSLETSKNLSSSAPGAISNQNCSLIQLDTTNDSNDSFDIELRHRQSKDSAMEEENCHSISCFTDSTEQSAPVNFDMSNRAKLPRGIENIRPHLENVDNVPLLVSLFTDCSAEATREMLGIMQSYGEIVVCIGSSASNANAEIFLQADCSIAIEPLYPQVCQDIPTYTEANILNNNLTVVVDHIVDGKSKKFWSKYMQQPQKHITISPIYLSRMLNSVACSIAVCRDDPLSIVSIIELSRRFSNGLWSCIQFWACCGCSLALMNTLCACLSLPPMLTAESLIYLMGIAIPVLSTSLVCVEPDPQVMHRATAKKQTKFDSKVFAFVLGCYGCKFLPTIAIMILSHCTFMSYPIDLLRTAENGFDDNLNASRVNILLAVILHFVVISMSFVHRDYSIWRKNPMLNVSWVITSIVLIVFHIFIYGYFMFAEQSLLICLPNVWPIILFLLISIIIVFGITELCKWEELKINLRYQRRARLDFGTKLGMNSPF